MVLAESVPAEIFRFNNPGSPDFPYSDVSVLWRLQTGISAYFRLCRSETPRAAALGENFARKCGRNFG